MLFPSLVDALCVLSDYILQMPLERREIPWTRVTLLANTRRRSKSHLLCASRQSLQLRKVAHHVPDSHLNAYIRLRLALTEQEPTIKPYEEARWAELEDAKSAPVEVSLTLLDSLHERWVRLLRSLKTEDFARTFRHPDHGVRTVDWLLFLYAWHGRHHTAHVTELRKRRGW